MTHADYTGNLETSNEEVVSSVAGLSVPSVGERSSRCPCGERSERLDEAQRSEPESDPFRLVNLRITGRGIGGVAYIAPGGMIVKRSMPERPSPGGGGTRGIITGFSEDSRTRCLQLLAKIDWWACQACFVTLTYHLSWPGWEGRQRHIAAFRRRLQRRWGDRVVSVLWKLEFQARGAPHYHCVIFWRPGLRPDAGNWRVQKGKASVWRGEDGFWEWVSRSWAEVTSDGASMDVDQYHYGCHVCDVKNHNREDMAKLSRYLAKYIGKVQGSPVGGVVPSEDGASWPAAPDRDTEIGEFEEGEELGTGRWWGVWWTLPTNWFGAIGLSPDGWESLAALIRRWGKGSPYLEGWTANRTGGTLLGAGEDFLELLGELGEEDIGRTHVYREVVVWEHRAYCRPDSPWEFRRVD